MERVFLLTRCQLGELVKDIFGGIVDYYLNVVVVFEDVVIMDFKNLINIIFVNIAKVFC